VHAPPTWDGGRSPTVTIALKARYRQEGHAVASAYDRGITLHRRTVSRSRAVSKCCGVLSLPGEEGSAGKTHTTREIRQHNSSREGKCTVPRKPSMPAPNVRQQLLLTFNLRFSPTHMPRIPCRLKGGNTSSLNHCRLPGGRARVPPETGRQAGRVSRCVRTWSQPLITRP
jgi:hypothetical protein